MQNIWFKGGYPEPLEKSNSFNNFYNEWMENYNATYINRDLAEIFPHLNKISYRRFLNMLAQLSGNILNRSDIARSLEVSEATIRNYLSIAAGTYLWRILPSFKYSVLKSTVKMPKGYIRDSGLLHYLLKINSLDDLYQHHMVGKSFESFVIEEIIKGISATPATNYEFNYYRSRSRVKVDLVINGPFGILPIEIKYGSTTKLSSLESLSNFIIDNKLSYGLLINQSNSAQWLTKNILQLPLNYI
jgi:predicted AAA+ superfamily ATPase